jgi:trimethylguanosine synthase
LDAVLDGFCGAGGDSIKLAMTCKLVYSNDIDNSKIKLLINNASIYGVDNIHPSCTDFFKIDFKRNDVNAVYLAPPWGGPEYHLQEKMQPEDF